MKFTRKGGVTLSVGINPLGYGKYDLVFSVSDTGLGISEEDQENIFSSFVQASSSTTRQYGGSGLGLSISLKLSHLLGGELWVESELGKGASFFFRVTLIGSDCVAPAKDDLLVVAGGGGENLAATLPLEILVAEDNEVNQEMILQMLDSLGYFADIVANGQEAVLGVGRKQYDVVLMDMQMPVMGGVEATKRIRRQLADRSPKIIAVTANVLSEARKEFFIRLESMASSESRLRFLRSRKPWLSVVEKMKEMPRLWRRIPTVFPTALSKANVLRVSSVRCFDVSMKDRSIKISEWIVGILCIERIGSRE